MSLSAQKTTEEMVTVPRYILEDSPALATKLQKFAEAEERAKKAIQLIGAADEILGLRDQAKAERDAADVASAEAREESVKLISDAISQAEDLVDDARTEAEEMIAKAETTVGEAQRVEENAQSTHRMATEALRTQAATKEDLDRRSEGLEVLSRELEEQQQLLLKEKSKLATVREQIDSILG